ncbi:ArsR family transcriptional regulator [Haloferax mediterranei ATCC 33500]|uniref:ArsR family transcriptional regulator n=2 Tax=Haloferacaceae TaxID=1644056 RepID=I3R3N0_HALMT|nr:helix-turn-helix domain-containing protein [Haloferax mediterranei]AFK18840.1 putative transcriptional regulator, ArsR family [Haloferax mediterranei ATCC 33500]AHZ21794.1 ArsR family transcriptional regulator [Haloferax mediterranei ATCC 33500]EMA03301.1 ArsR family transcriptional regulator [Haloferax mediterranei ATCC 33500]MDX5988934.1 helix-turn-helix domain-containing protein [Haloferax mediterranei ATCC 33500]QCQ76626.1 ArsR family transcriptional regulator [Haloferax mediterranei AT
MQTGLRRNPTNPAEMQAEQVLEALSDRACRQILTTLQGAANPMTAQELSSTCDVPLSTTYRKLEQLSDANLLEETLQLRANGTHTHEYRTEVDSVTVCLNDEDGLDVVIPGEF